MSGDQRLIVEMDSHRGTACWRLRLRVCVCVCVCLCVFGPTICPDTDLTGEGIARGLAHCVVERTGCQSQTTHRTLSGEEKGVLCW